MFIQTEDKYNLFNKMDRERRHAKSRIADKNLRVFE